jgi:hypothetical protein
MGVEKTQDRHSPRPVRVVARQTIAGREGAHMRAQFALLTFEPPRVWFLRRQLDENAFGPGRRPRCLTSAWQQLVLKGLCLELYGMTMRVRQVIEQTRMRIFGGNARDGKLLSLFEPSTEVIRKGTAGKPKFGKMVKLQEAENQIITDCEI